MTTTSRPSAAGTTAASTTPSRSTVSRSTGWRVRSRAPTSRAVRGPALRTGRPPRAGGIRSGVDVVALARFDRLLALRGQALTDRVFTPHEIATCAGAPARLAARLAAKEAVAKALGTGIGPVAWRDVETRTGADGAPSLALHGTAATLARRLGLSRWAVSLSHDGASAVAVVVAIERGQVR